MEDALTQVRNKCKGNFHGNLISADLAVIDKLFCKFSLNLHQILV